MVDARSQSCIDTNQQLDTWINHIQILTFVFSGNSLSNQNVVFSTNSFSVLTSIYNRSQNDFAKAILQLMWVEKKSPTCLFPSSKLQQIFCSFSYSVPDRKRGYNCCHFITENMMAGETKIMN